MHRQPRAGRRRTPGRGRPRPRPGRGAGLVRDGRPWCDLGAGDERGERLIAGDPAKAATALIQAVESDSPPYMLLLGNDTSDGFRAALDALRTEADTWETLSRSTDFDA